MKVLQINSVCGSGSTGKIAVDLYNLMKTRNIDCKIAYGRGTAKNIQNEDTIKIGNKSDIYLHAAASRLTDKTGFYSKKSTRAFINEIKKYNPDIIHLHNIHGYYINVEILFDYLRTCGKKIIWTLHDCWPFTGHCSYFDLCGCDKWQTACGSCPQRGTYPKSYADNSENNYRLKKKIFTGIPNLTIVTPSEWLAGLVRKSFLSEYDTKVINNGIDLSIFKPSPSDFRKAHGLEDKKIILSVANVWTVGKGFGDVLEFAKTVDDSYKIVMVGVDKDQKKNLPRNIIGIDRTGSQQELAQLYSAADVFINPTYEDNYPTVNLEALACGTPIAVYDTGGCGEVVAGGCGRIAAKKTPAALLDAVNDIISSVKKPVESKKKLGVYENFEDYITLYNE